MIFDDIAARAPKRVERVSHDSQRTDAAPRSAAQEPAKPEETSAPVYPENASVPSSPLLLDAVNDRLQAEEAGVGKVDGDKAALPTPQQAFVQLERAKLHLRARSERIDRERLPEDTVKPERAEDSAANNAITKDVATEVLANDFAADSTATKELLSDVSAEARALEDDNDIAAAAEDSDLSESEADSVTSEIDTTIASVARSGANGSPEMVRELEAEKGAIQDAEIAVEELRQQQERNAAFEQAQKQIAMQRMKEAEVAHQTNAHQREAAQRTAQMSRAQRNILAKEKRSVAKKAMIAALHGHPGLKSDKLKLISRQTAQAEAAALMQHGQLQQKEEEILNNDDQHPSSLTHNQADHFDVHAHDLSRAYVQYTGTGTSA